MGTLYVGVGGTARKVNKLYVGVNGVARRVKKLYVGVNGVARKVFSSEPSYYGTATTLSANRAGIAGISFGGYALFAGGATQWQVFSGYTFVGTVEAYNSSLTKTSLTAMSLFNTTTGYGKSFHVLSATTVGNYVLFGSGPVNTNIIYAYDTSFTQSTKRLSDSRSRIAATHVGNYALFAGGGDGSSTYSSVDALDTSLTVTSAPNLPNPNGTPWKPYDYLESMAGTNIGNYAIFAGGRSSVLDDTTCVANAFAYDSSLTVSMPTNLSVGRAYMAATSIGNYALFGGGAYISSSSAVYVDSVDAYDSSLTKSNATALSVARSSLSATILDDYAMFGGGVYSSDSNYWSNLVEAYDGSLTKSTLDSNLSVGRSSLGAASVGNYALFAGGTLSNTNADFSNVVDVYEI